MTTLKDDSETSLRLLIWMTASILVIAIRSRNTQEEQFANLSKREQELANYRRRQKLHFETTPLAAIEWNDQFEVINWNPAAEKMFGYSKTEVVNQHIREHILPSDLETSNIVDEVWKNLIKNTGGRRSINFNRTKEGNKILCNWYNSALVDNSGNVIGVASIIEDITDRQLALQKEQIRVRVLSMLSNEEPLAEILNIPVTEETGMIVEIGDWVMKEAAQTVKKWRDNIQTNMQLSINVSPIQFRDKLNISQIWLGQMEKLALPGESIVLEITEGLLMENPEEIMGELKSFHAAGLAISLDDFGTGYSSLSYLKKFDMDFLKIDRSFVMNLTADSDDFALCEAIIVMAHKLNLKVIAEGIETDDQKNLLASAGCDFGQGYLFSRPLPAIGFEQLLLQRSEQLHHVNKIN